MFFTETNISYFLVFVSSFFRSFTMFLITEIEQKQIGSKQNDFVNAKCAKYKHNS